MPEALPSGVVLRDRSPVSGVLGEDIHYRLYDRRTGRVLSSNTTTALSAIVQDVADTARAYPDAQISVVRYDGTA
jgi:hypothetical protein